MAKKQYQIRSWLKPASNAEAISRDKLASIYRRARSLKCSIYKGEGGEYPIKIINCPLGKAFIYSA